MSILTELLNEAKDELLQEEWDRTLLQAFRSTKYPSVSLVVDTFRAKHKLTREQFHKIKRTPKYARHFETRIPRFIAAYLPALNDRLYDTNLNDDALIAWMNKVNLEIESTPADRPKADAEHRIRHDSGNRMAINSLEISLRQDYHARYGRKWSTVKAVRNKS